jgi:copper transport protein
VEKINFDCKKHILAVCIIVILFVFLMPFKSEAHSAIEKTSPQSGQVLETPPSRIDVWFEEPVDVYSNSIKVIVGRTEIQAGKPVVDPKDQRYVITHLGESLPDGKYDVVIHALALDGHEIKESYSFELKKAIKSQGPAKLEKTFPEDGEILSASPERMEFWFTQPMDVETLGIFDDHGNSVKFEKPTQELQDPKHIIVKMSQNLSPGTYAVRWITKTGPDGIFYFAVGEVSFIDYTGKRIYKFYFSKLSWETAARWLSFIGLLGLLGGAWFTRFIAKQTGDFRRWNRVVWILYGMSVAGIILQLIQYRVKLSDATLNEIILFRSGWVPILQLFILGLAFLLKKKSFHIWFLCSAVILFSLTGHSASPEYGGGAGIVVAAFHLVASAIWLGGLLGLLLMMPKEESVIWLKETGRCFSKWALISTMILSITGFWMFIQYVPSFNWLSLIGSEWGRALLYKVMLFFGVIGFGYWQRKALAAKTKEWILPFLVRARIEVLIGLILLFLASVLVDMSPKAAQRGIYEDKVIQNGIEANLDISPLQIGSNETTVRFSDSSSFKKVRMKFFMPPDLTTEYTAFSLGNGVYRVVGNQLHAPGTMYIDVKAIQSDGQTVMFPFKVQIPGEIVEMR